MNMQKLLAIAGSKMGMLEKNLDTQFIDMCGPKSFLAPDLASNSPFSTALLPVLGYGVSGDGFRCCRWFEVDGVWLILSLIFWSCAVGIGGLRSGFWVNFSGGLARGGLRGGSRWVCGVARGGDL
jgi:hypothetical protein